MKKTTIAICIIVTIFIIILNINNQVYANQNENEVDINNTIKDQSNSLNISKFISESKKYSDNILENQDIDEIFNKALEGKVENKSIINNIAKILFKELLNAISSIGIIIVIIIIHSIIKNISGNLEDSTTSKITYYSSYIMIVAIVMKNFADIINMVKESIQNLTGFINCLFPLLMSLLITTGNIQTATFLQPLILICITFIGNTITKVIIPLALISLALSIISNISDKVQIGKLSKFINSSSILILGTLLTLFVTVASLEGSLTKGVDTVAAKTTKAAVSGCIPVVGKILGDAVETVMGCSNVLKNAVGIVGIIIIIGICITPIIKLLTLMGVYYLGAAICEPIADTKIIKLLDQIGNIFKLLLAIMLSVSTMLIIGITLIIKMSGIG